MNEERIKELFSDEEYVKGLFELGSYEAVSVKLAEDGVEVSSDELKKGLELVRKKVAGQLSDEELEEVAGGFDIVFAGIAATIAGSGLGATIAVCVSEGMCD